MTEAEWNQSGDLEKMLRLPLLKDKISYRKLRLFACACCRRMWHLLTDDLSRNVVEVAEKYADGLAAQEDLESAREMAQHAATSPVITCRTVLGTAVHYTPGSVASSTAATGIQFSPRATASSMAMFAVEAARDREAYVAERNEQAADRAAYVAERKEQAAIFRELIGNPFRSVTFDWLTFPVTSLAQAIYDERTYDRLPILADALEDAGCTNQDVLEHCRQPGGHYRGCWVVDLLLSKQ
jgi:hypothetical protein